MSELAAAHAMSGMSLAVWIESANGGTTVDVFCAVSLIESDVATLQNAVVRGEVYIVLDTRR
jgi:hypothetical protein